MSNQIQRLYPPNNPPIAAPPAQTQVRREYRERDFGVGYGRSSGYAGTRQYVHAWNGQPRFRCS